MNVHYINISFSIRYGFCLRPVCEMDKKYLTILNQIRYHFSNQIGNQVGNQVWDQLERGWEQTQEQVRLQIMEQVFVTTKNSF